MWHARAVSVYTCYPIMSSQSGNAELVKCLSGIVVFQAADASFDLPPGYWLLLPWTQRLPCYLLPTGSKLISHKMKIVILYPITRQWASSSSYQGDTESVAKKFFLLHKLLFSVGLIWKDEAQFESFFPVRHSILLATALLTQHNRILNLKPELQQRTHVSTSKFLPTVKELGF